MKNAHLFLAAAFAFVASAAIAQTTITVPGDQPTIQAGINAALDGDTVLVSPGTYSETIDLMGKEITLVSSDGPGVTVIDGGGAGPIVTMTSGETANTILEGFTIQNGFALFGAGIDLIAGSPVIRGNIFNSNTQDIGGSGAAISGNVSSPLIEGNLFTNNSCDTQFLSGTVAFTNASSPTIVNNVFLNNPCRGVTITSPGGQAHEVSNNTFVGNATGIRVNIFVDASGQLIRNNIIVQNTEGYDMANVAPAFLNNLVFNNTTNYVGIADQTGLNGNISADPMFVNLPGGDVRIDALSPARDMGDGTAALPAFDFEGDDRVIGGTVDIGADEYNPNASLPLSPWGLAAPIACALLVALRFTRRDASGAK